MRAVPYANMSSLYDYISEFSTCMPNVDTFCLEGLQRFIEPISRISACFYEHDESHRTSLIYKGMDNMSKRSDMSQR